VASRDSGRVVRHRHCRAADNEQIRHDTAPGESISERGKRPFQIGSAHEYAARLGHAVTRSWLET
jgi:hypothetical protein